MQTVRIIRRSERRVLGVSLVLMLLLMAAVNVPFAVTRIHARMTPPPTHAVFFQGVAAGGQGWPARFPPEHVWPAPESLTVRRTFGVRIYDARTAPPASGGNGFSMSVQHLGWPLPVIEIKEMWWDWNDPALGDPANGGPEPDPRPRLMPLGFAFNPVLVGVPLWLVLLVAPVAIVRMHRRRLARRWTRRGACPRCGYAEVGQGVCPECGPQAPLAG
jgi:hypothetical protein